MELAVYVYMSTVFMILVGLAIIVRVTCKDEKRERRERRNGTGQNEPAGNSALRTVEFIDCSQSDQNRVYNISSHVQNQNQTQYPDGHLSMEHITITNELNKPPKYDDAPPTYEEAVKLAMAHSNSIQTFQAEQQQNHEQPQTSSSSTAPAMVHAAPHRTTE